MRYANFCYNSCMDKVLEKTDRLLRLRNYSTKTCKAYLLYIKDYITFSKKNRIRNKQKAIEAFLLNKHKRRQSPQTINLALNAVKFLYAEVLKDPQKIDLKFAKRSKKLPIVLSQTEIEKGTRVDNHAKMVKNPLYDQAKTHFKARENFRV